MGEKLTNVLDLPDDQIQNMPMPEIAEEQAEQAEQEYASDDQDAGQEAAQETTQEAGEGEDTPSSFNDSMGGPEAPQEVEGEGEETSERQPYEGGKQTEPKKAEPSLKDADLAAMAKELFAPFKANGRDMQVTTVEDARRLMQMGANYQKKMAGMKPSLRILKALEQNDLLSEDKINFLIDLSKRKPAAIGKLMKDGDISPMDIDTDEETTAQYKPEYHVPSTKEAELDEVLDEIRETPTFQRTVDELTKKWDAQSKQVLLERPSLIKVLNEHMSLGVYDQIINIVENERMLGRLTEVPDLEAYKMVGDAIEAKGGFAHLAQKKSRPANVQQKAQQSQSANINEKKRAASPTRGSAASVGSNEFNPLALSDEEFSRIATSFR